jgi:methionine-rich copper-binding protein CopC
MAFWVVAVAAAPAAQAHATLLRTNPAKEALLPRAPEEVVLTFSETPIGIGTTVRVAGPDAVVSLGQPRVIDNTVHQTLSRGLGGGRYIVTWRVTSDDGHPVSGTFAFTVEGTSSQSASRSAAPSATTAAHKTTPKTHTSRLGPFMWAIICVIVLTLTALAVVLVIRHSSHERTS